MFILESIVGMKQKFTFLEEEISKLLTLKVFRCPPIFGQNVRDWSLGWEGHQFCSTYVVVAPCSRIAHNPNFISQFFYHFSSFIHIGDNLNMYENLSFHQEFLRKLKICR